VIPDSNTINNNYKSAIKAYLASLDSSQPNILSNCWKSDIETQIEANMAEIEAQADQISKLTTASTIARIQTDHNATTIAQQATTIKQLEEKLYHAISRIASVESRCDTSHSTFNAICSSSQEALR
jgi:ribonuclease HII